LIWPNIMIENLVEPYSVSDNASVAPGRYVYLRAGELAAARLVPPPPWSIMTTGVRPLYPGGTWTV
jgi:hypothetical protein